jgi:hypothetical protein
MCALRVVTTATQAQAVNRPQDVTRGFSTRREGEDMEIDRFDALTRALSTTDSRRRTLRALGGTLLGGVLGGVAATLGLGENGEAKAKKHKKGHKDRKQSGHVQAAGKHHKKHKHNDKHKNKAKDKDKPEPDICGNGKPKCPDGSCVPVGECCPGSKRCGDGFCHKEAHCCPEEKICDDGSCASQDVCCPGNRPCPGGGCVKPNTCCPGGEEKTCPDGECVAPDTCCLGEFKCFEGDQCHPIDYCCPGWRRCTDGSCAGEGECCTDEKKCCPDCPCVSKNYCCHDHQSQCTGCEYEECVLGDWICVSGCRTGEVCCGGSCKSMSCPPGQEFDSETCQCKVACPAGQETCADDTCCDGQCTQHTCCPANQDFCLGTCCVPGYRCVKNGRHGICCKPEQTEDCYSVYGHFVGCLDPIKCYCDTLAGRVVCNP